MTTKPDRLTLERTAAEAEVTQLTKERDEARAELEANALVLQKLQDERDAAQDELEHVQKAAAQTSFDTLKIKAQIDAMESVCPEGKREITALVEAIIGAPLTPPAKERWFGVIRHCPAGFFHVKPDGTNEWLNYNGKREPSCFTAADAEDFVKDGKWVELATIALVPPTV